MFHPVDLSWDREEVESMPHRQTQILLLNMTEWDLFFNISPFAMYILFLSVLQCFIEQKSHKYQIWCHHMNFSIPSDWKLRYKVKKQWTKWSKISNGGKNMQMIKIWFGLVLWHINHCRLFNVKSSLYIYIKYIWFGLVGFYGISTIVGYLMSNPLYTYILNIYDLVWLGFMAYQPLSVI